MADPLTLRAYLAAGPLLRPLVDRHLRKRVAKGKEDPARVHEKKGIASLPAPTKPVIWCHAVGVGEALALTGFAEALRDAAPDHDILITTSVKTAAEVFARNAPDWILHQYLPVDVPPYADRFLHHWSPALAIWAERDIWPRLMVETARRGIPQVIVNGRMNETSFAQKLRAKRLFEACYTRCAFIDVQDDVSETHFGHLAPRVPLSVSGSMKAYGPPLADHPEDRAAWENTLDADGIWLGASVHMDEFDAMLETHHALQRDGNWKSILAPRNPSEADALLQKATQKGLTTLRTSMDAPADCDLVIEDRLGFMGLWYRLADCAFIGGSWDATGGHNPYEPARLGCPFFHGVNVQNFANDYQSFAGAGLSLEVASVPDLVRAITERDLNTLSHQLSDLANHGEVAIRALAQRCANLIHQAE